MPGGPQQRIFDIKYYDRDTRRRVIRQAEELHVRPGGLSSAAAKEAGAAELPPVPGRVTHWHTVDRP